MFLNTNSKNYSPGKFWNTKVIQRGMNLKKNRGHSAAHFSLQLQQGTAHKLPFPILLLTQVNVKLPAVGETLSLCKRSHSETIGVMEIAFPCIAH